MRRHNEDNNNNTALEACQWQKQCVLRWGLSMMGGLYSGALKKWDLGSRV